MLHLPDCPAYRHNVQIAGFQEPDESVFFVFFCKFIYLIIFCSGQIYKAVHTSTNQPSLHLCIYCLLCPDISMKNFFFCDMIRLSRMLLIFQRLFFPSVISVQHMFLTGQYLVCVVNRRMPRIHSKCRCTWSVYRCRIAECGKQKCHISIVRITHIPFRICFLYAVKIDIIEYFTHQFPAAAGNQHV